MSVTEKFPLTVPNTRHVPNMLKSSNYTQLSRWDINFGNPIQSMDRSKTVNAVPKSTQDTRENAYGLAAAHSVILGLDFLVWQF